MGKTDQEANGKVFKHLQVIIPAIVLLAALVGWCLGLSSRITTLEVSQKNDAAISATQSKRITNLSKEVINLPSVMAITKKNTEDIRDLSIKIENIRELLIELRTILTLRGQGCGCELPTRKKR